MIRFLNLPNLITLTGLVLALASALLAANGRLAHALAALIGAGICDLFDGFVARKLALSDEARTFGARLDSVVDGCAFGIAPAILLHFAGLHTPPELALLALFACCAAFRLAYFDTVGLATEGAAKYYTGLPTTFTALVLPLALLAGFHSKEAMRLAADVATPALSLAMVSPFKVRKPGGAWYAIFAVLAIAMVSVYLALADRFAASS